MLVTILRNLNDKTGSSMYVFYKYRIVCMCYSKVLSALNFEVTYVFTNAISPRRVNSPIERILSVRSFNYLWNKISLDNQRTFFYNDFTY